MALYLARCETTNTEVLRSEKEGCYDSWSDATLQDATTDQIVEFLCWEYVGDYKTLSDILSKHCSEEQRKAIFVDIVQEKGLEV